MGITIFPSYCFQLKLGVILEIAGRVQQKHKWVLFKYKKNTKKGLSALKNLYLHSIFTLLFVSQVF